MGAVEVKGDAARRGADAIPVGSGGKDGAGGEPRRMLKAFVPPAVHSQDISWFGVLGPITLSAGAFRAVRCSFERVRAAEPRSEL